jgi:hypothetical protein
LSIKPATLSNFYLLFFPIYVKISLEIDIYVSIRILEKSCRYLRHWLHKIKSSHQAMLMIKSTQVDFFVAIVKKGVIWYDKSRKEKNQYE